MSPWALAKFGSEHGEQAALFSWLFVASRHGFKAAYDEQSYTVKGHAVATYGEYEAMPDLAFAFAIPNGGSRGSTKDAAMRVGATLKAEGVKKGVSDVFVPIPRHGRGGLFIEMKREAGGTVSKEQKDFGNQMIKFNFGFCVCYGWKEAAKLIQQWMQDAPSQAPQGSCEAE